jgi:hypothetical protein
MYAMAALLVIGLIANALVKPIHDKHYMETAADPAKPTPTGREATSEA